jgi:hypothetical protein
MFENDIDVDDIDELAREAIENNSHQLARERLCKIDPRIHTYYNSINVFVGRQGQGKTYSAIKEIAKVTRANKRTCLVVYVTKEGNKCDDTMESLKHLIGCPILYIAEADAEKCISVLQEAMNFYKDIKDFHLENEVRASDRNQLFDTLSIEDFNEPYLHIIILFDDFANSALIKKPDSYFSKFIATLRHRGFSVFICIQFWRSIPTQLKSNISMIYIFPSFSAQQIRYILDQVPTQKSWREIMKDYQTLNVNDKLIVDTITGDIFIEYV